MTDFVHLKVRSHWSAAGTSAPAALAWRALSQEHKTLALTDDMTLAGLPEFIRACQQAGIRPIAGCTVYHAPVSPESTARRAYPVTALIESLAGYHNLLQLLNRLRAVALPWRLGKSAAPLRDILGESEGLIILAGGPGSELGEAAAAGNARAASLFLDALCDICPRRQIAVEIARLGAEQINPAEPGLLELAQRWELAAVASNDVFCATPLQFPAHHILKAAASARGLNGGGGAIPAWPPAGIPHLAPASEMLRKFSDARKLCLAAAELAGRCAFHPGEEIAAIEFGAGGDAASAPPDKPSQPDLSIHFPKLDFPRGQSEESYVWNAIFERAREQHSSVAGELKERLNREFEALKNAGCLPYLAFLARLAEGLPRHMCHRFRRPGFASSQVAYYLGLNYLSPHDLKISFSLDDVASGLGGPIQLEIPAGCEDIYRRALSGLMGEERLASLLSVMPAPAEDVTRLLTGALNLQGKEARTAAEFIGELAGEAAPHFFGDDMPEPALEEIIQNPGAPNALARLFFDLRDASPRAAADDRRLIFSNTNLGRQMPLFYPDADGGAAAQWPLEAIGGARFPQIEFIPRSDFQLVTLALQSLHEEGLGGAPRDVAAIPVEHKSVQQLLASVDTALIPPLAGIEARAGLQRLKPDSFSALTKLLTPATAALPFFDRVAELALACKMAYLQTNYLQDYFLAYVEQRLGDPVEMRRILRRLRREHIPVYGPRLNISGPRPTLRDGGLQLAIAMLRGYTPRAFEAIAAARREMPFSGLVDFLQRVDTEAVPREFITSLIQAGAFDIIERHRRRLWEQWQRIAIWLAQTATARPQANSLAMDWDTVRRLYDETARSFDNLPDWNLEERLDNERHACGFEISGLSMECHREFLDQSNIYTGPISKRLLRKGATFFWAGYAESWSAEHPQLEMLDNHALLDFGEFWGVMPLALFKECQGWLTQFEPGVLQLAPSPVQGLALLEVQWAAPLDACAQEAASRPSFHIDCAGWEGAQFRQMRRLWKLFPGQTRLEFQRVPARFVRKAARMQAKGVYYSPTFYRALPVPPAP